ncbi:putative MFS family arabinose efflux permease [Spirosoma oryzae]|uniref:Putative MFS family arabinose efflux permease n=1 Tax=Spirosoma oryzae TaxID=1469603 RepID=A0A2T0SHA5_9BACT|nr:MFS transporter [Spirosoma oryzae]PRY32777.1 putative MFS family arabinose efflux permease [Spirosoma oryzae]
MSSGSTSFRPLFSLPVIVAALGYFVDVYDLLLFNIVRVPSLKDMGLSEAAISLEGGRILNIQQAGLLLGGILWGVLGDKRGRLSVLFGSIITYSLANIACGFVHDPGLYAVLRFIAGLGLAGELGAGITLVSEILPRQLRGYGSSLVAGVGLFGAVVAYFTVSLFDWRTTYFIGGGLGLGLLLLRVTVLESVLYRQAQQTNVKRGNFWALFQNRDRLMRYIWCMGISLPTYFVIGILATFGNEFGKALDLPDAIQPGRSVMFTYVGMVAGDLLSGPFSQLLRSRRKAIGLMMGLTLVFVLLYLFGGISSTNVFYALCVGMGFGIGYIALFLTVTAESFGTNLRATATTSVANNVRATTLLSIPAFQAMKPAIGTLAAGGVIGLVCFSLAFLSLLKLPETFGRDLDYSEE